MPESSYDRISGLYDLLSGPAEGPLRLEAVELLAPCRGDTVLDIGCGTAQATRELAARGAQVWGIDISNGMLGVARRNLRRQPSGNAFLCRADARRMPFASGAANGILMSFTLEIFPVPDMHALLDECKRVLVTSGRLCVVSLARRRPAPLAQRAYERLHRLLPRLIDCRPIDVAGSLRDTGFAPDVIRNLSLFGLPVTLVRALAPPR